MVLSSHRSIIGCIDHDILPRRWNRPGLDRGGVLLGRFRAGRGRVILDPILDLFRGKAVTPFLLSEMARRTGGKSLRANLALLTNNASFAGRLAVAYAQGSKA